MRHETRTYLDLDMPITGEDIRREARKSLARVRRVKNIEKLRLQVIKDIIAANPMEKLLGIAKTRFRVPLDIPEAVKISFRENEWLWTAVKPYLQEYYCCVYIDDKYTMDYDRDDADLGSDDGEDEDD